MWAFCLISPFSFPLVHGHDDDDNKKGERRKKHKGRCRAHATVWECTTVSQPSFETRKGTFFLDLLPQYFHAAHSSLLFCAGGFLGSEADTAIFSIPLFLPSSLRQRSRMSLHCVKKRKEKRRKDKEKILLEKYYRMYSRGSSNTSTNRMLSILNRSLKLCF